MRIRVNGHDEECAEGTTLLAFLEAKGVNPSLVACELNMDIIRRARLGETVLKDGDVLEVLRMIGGG